MPKQTYKCQKESDLAVMALKIEVIEKNVTEVHRKLDDFITSADSRYASQRELTALKEAIKEEFNSIKAEQRWSKEKIFSIAKDVAIVGAVVTLLVKKYI